jgi:hypothetical protein
MLSSQIEGQNSVLFITHLTPNHPTSKLHLINIEFRHHIELNAPATNIDHEYCLAELILFVMKMVRKRRFVGKEYAVSNVKSWFNP